MTNKKIFLAFLLICVLIISGCVTTRPLKKLSYEEIKKKEKEDQILLTKIIFTFVGSALGGTIGVVSAPQDAAFRGAVSGCVVGGAAGFILGYVISENSNQKQPQPVGLETEDYFNDYRNIKLKDKK